MKNKTFEKKLSELPKLPGIYFHKDKDGEIIYVGKAANLRNRARQYFQKSRARDPKTDALIGEIEDLDWMVVDSEIEALFLEAEMIRRYRPRYNILLRDDKSMVYIRIDIDSDYPTVSTTRRPLDDKAKYYGPYLSKASVRQALKMLRRVFPYATRRVGGQKRASLHYHLGLDPGLEDGKTSLDEYRANLRRMIAVIEGRRKSIEKELERDMKKAAKASEFEKAASLRNQLFALRRLTTQIVFSDKEFQDISKDHALTELSELLSLYEGGQHFLRRLYRIEGYDVSHMSGTDVVASMVVFTNGATDKSEYRKFKTRQNKNDDFYNMNETIKRRFSSRNTKKWRLPDLVLIDGGKGQLDAAIKARNETEDEKLHAIPYVGLAKREEQLVIKKDGSNVELNHSVLHRLGGFTSETPDFILVNLPKSTNLVKLLQRIRDESHRFAVSYHSVLKTKRQTSSVLDEIPGIGPSTRKKLLRKFGSLRGIAASSEEQLAEVVGKSKALAIVSHLNIS